MSEGPRIVTHRGARDPLWDRIFVETLTDMNMAAAAAATSPTLDNIRELARAAAQTTQVLYEEAVKVRDRGEYVE